VTQTMSDEYRRPPGDARGERVGQVLYVLMNAGDPQAPSSSHRLDGVVHAAGAEVGAKPAKNRPRAKLDALHKVLLASVCSYNRTRSRFSGGDGGRAGRMSVRCRPSFDGDVLESNRSKEACNK